LYAFLKTPIYEVKALVEIGSYKSSNSDANSIALLDSASELSKKLNVMFVDEYKNKKGLPAKIISIEPMKDQKGDKFIEIKAEGVSNDEAIAFVNRVMKYIKKEHQLLLDDVKIRREYEINNLQKAIESAKNREIPLIESKIKVQKDALEDRKRALIRLEENINTISKGNPALTALKLMEKRNLSQSILNLDIALLDLKNKKDMTEKVELIRLKEQMNILKTMLLPYNYKNTEIVGNIIQDEHPTKPKKILVVVVSFVTGLILALFMVFFLEFIKNFKEEE